MKIVYISGTKPKIAIVATTKRDKEQMKIMVQDMRDDSDNNGGKFSYRPAVDGIKKEASLFIEVNY